MNITKELVEEIHSRVLSGEDAETVLTDLKVLSDLTPEDGSDTSTSNDKPVTQVRE